MPREVVQDAEQIDLFHLGSPVAARQRLAIACFETEINVFTDASSSVLSPVKVAVGNLVQHGEFPTGNDGLDSHRLKIPSDLVVYPQK